MGVRLGAISRLHAFPRAQDHLTSKTVAGAIVTLLGVLTMVVLFIHELNFYTGTYTVHEMTVDKSPRDTRLSIQLNITFPALPCHVLSLDALDMSGKHEVDLHTTIFKERIDQNGRRLSRELIEDLVEGEHKEDHHKPTKPAGLALEDFFLETSHEHELEVAKIKEALARKEGCWVHGHLMVQRVAGNFHISVHSHSFFVLQKVFANVGEVNVSHRIHRMGFGIDYPGRINPLDGFERFLQPNDLHSGGTFKYFLKVVPTDFHHLGQKDPISTNQYSVTEYFAPVYKNENNLPAVFFLYDLSPITVQIKEKRRNFFHFLTRLCAVLGGTFALTGMFDRWVYLLVQQLTSGGGRETLGNLRSPVMSSSPNR
eukprot:TRINITY_DN874_c0_g1_i1.p1 TRINITY_DN874_c0_g1~~TRINITY_DN874_c0_g1_i1.p1  ORF type:complete len:370 (+),score=50.40 TRINITY_DN874_c0_g1_i1:278-1387(+)